MPKRTPIIAFLLLAWLAPLSAQTAIKENTIKENDQVAVRAGRLFDGKSDRLSTDQVILIRADRITDVGRADRIRIPAGARVIDLSLALGRAPSHSRTGRARRRSD